MITSTPKVKPQPDQMSYGLDVLEVFTRFTRATYNTAFGEQPLTWDKTRQIKRWFDTSVAALDPDATYIDPLTGRLPFYFVPDGKGGAVKKNITLTNREAMTVNLPGLYVYPKYDIPASGAYVPIWDETGTKVLTKQYLRKEDLSNRKDATDLIAEITAAGIAMDPDPTETTFGGIFAFRYDEGETRRIWTIQRAGMPGSLNTVGRLLMAKNERGVGAPGHWDIAKDTGNVMWVSDLPMDTGEQDPRPEVAIPNRDLMTNERFGSVGNMMAAGQTVVYKTDNAATVALDDTQAMPVRVREIHKKVMSLPF